MLKSCSDIFFPIIAKLANMLFAEGVFPNAIKVAQIKPLLKKDRLDKDKPANYRPISSLNTISGARETISKQIEAAHSTTARHKQISVSIQTKAFYGNRTCQDHELCPQEHEHLMHDMLDSPWDMGCFWYHRPQHTLDMPFKNVWCLWHIAKILSKQSAKLCQDQW